MLNIKYEIKNQVTLSRPIFIQQTQNNNKNTKTCFCHSSAGTDFQCKDIFLPASGDSGGTVRHLPRKFWLRYAINFPLRLRGV
jgi:hypothetical protein